MSFVPFVSSPHEVVRKMLELARVGPDDTLYDLGCGDARILVVAAEEFGVKRAVGYEIRSDIYKTALQTIEKHNLMDRVKIINEDLYNADLSDATVITLYLTTSANERLKPKLEKEVPHGARIVSHDFSMGSWKHAWKEKLSDHTIYLYVTPNSFE